MPRHPRPGFQIDQIVLFRKVQVIERLEIELGNLAPRPQRLAVLFRAAHGGVGVGHVGNAGLLDPQLGLVFLLGDFIRGDLLPQLSAAGNQGLLFVGVFGFGDLVREFFLLVPKLIAFDDQLVPGLAKVDQPIQIHGDAAVSAVLRDGLLVFANELKVQHDLSFDDFFRPGERPV